MNILDSIILGIVQGLTEFLPISSSGHLILTREILGEQDFYGLAYDAVLQFATTIAIIVYFKKDIYNLIKVFFKIIQKKETHKKDVILFYSILVGTIPALLIGLFLEDYMDTIFRNSLLVVITLLLGSLVMLFAEKFSKKISVKQELSIKKSVLIGFFQSLALIPGMSRSGMTISGGLFLGLNREESTRFAFLLAFPILIGSGLKKVFDLYKEGLIIEIGSAIIVGSITAFIVGLLAIHFLINYLKKNTLLIFVWYRIILAIITVFLIF